MITSFWLSSNFFGKNYMIKSHHFRLSSNQLSRSLQHQFLQSDAKHWRNLCNIQRVRDQTGIYAQISISSKRTSNCKNWPRNIIKHVLLIIKQKYIYIFILHPLSLLVHNGYFRSSQSGIPLSAAVCALFVPSAAASRGTRVQSHVCVQKWV